MGKKLVVGPPIDKGLRTDRLPFAIDNDSFPQLINAYQWRGRAKRKRGTSNLGRNQRFFNSTGAAYSSSATITLDGSGNGNILTGFSLQASGNIIPGTVKVTDTISAITYVDSGDGTFSPSGTIVYSSGAITIAAAANHACQAVFSYYPGLPSMGIRDLVLNAVDFPGTLSFDTVYSYSIQNASPYTIFDVSFYKNLPTGTPGYTGYIQKTNWTPTTWNGQNYQQFWTVNYQGAFWATNGVTIPFNSSNIGMQYKPIAAVTVTAGGPPAIVNLQINTHGLVVGDFLFINEVVTTTGINLQTGYVTAIVDANNVTVEFPNATIAANGTGGIAQYLTNRADPTKDCIRWYDGSPVDGQIPPTFQTGSGWVNFMPPLSNSAYPISDNPSAIYYLVGARIILPFKGFLLFIGPVIQTSSAGSQVYLQDTIIWSQKGTPYYTSSFTGSITDVTTNFNPILVPNKQTAVPMAYFEDLSGFGGFAEIVNAQPITSASPNEDVLILGGSNYQKRLVYNGNIITPFDTFTINSELGTSSTFSTITMDRGVLSIGNRGIVITSQISTERIDLPIPDAVFEFDLTNNGPERICSQRDFINEWVYFTYPSNDAEGDEPSLFPNQTLQYNYRDNSWAVFNESYTSYGQFRKQTGFTWATVGSIYPTWDDWTDDWAAGASTLLQPQVIAGNSQGFITIRENGTGEGISLSIYGFSGNTVTCPDHCLNNGDYIVINSCIGTISSFVNGLVFQVSNITRNTFDLDGPAISGTYAGGGTITRMYKPLIQSKQFPLGWELGRKTRIGPQQYLLSATNNAQITLNIYLSQDSATAYNNEEDVVNGSLIYSTVLYTCPESSNLGLTPANTNLQMIAFPETGTSTQNQIWHRINTSLIGDTVQVGFTLSDAQMRDSNLVFQFAEIELHSLIIDVSPSSMLA